MLAAPHDHQFRFNQSSRFSNCRRPLRSRGIHSTPRRSGTTGATCLDPPNAPARACRSFLCRPAGRKTASSPRGCRIMTTETSFAVLDHEEWRIIYSRTIGSAGHPGNSERRFTRGRQIAKHSRAGPALQNPLQYCKRSLSPSPRPGMAGITTYFPHPRIGLEHGDPRECAGSNQSLQPVQNFVRLMAVAASGAQQAR
jgi:hypothetical protein